MVQNGLKSIVEALEKDLFDEIIIALKKGKLSKEKASLIAKEYLSFLPFTSKEDLLVKVHLLSIKYEEVIPVYLKIAAPINESSRQNALDQTRSFIRAGSYDKAAYEGKGQV